MGLVGGPWLCTPLTLGPHWDFSCISSCCPVSWRLWEPWSAGLLPPSPHAPGITDVVDVWAGQHITLVLGSDRVGQPASSSSPGERSSTALASSPLAVTTRGGAAASTFTSSELVLPRLHLQGQLHCVAQTRYRGSSPKCCRC